MFSKHVKRKLSAYCHGELATAESRRVAEHLIGCHRCRAEFEEIKLGVKLAEQLPEVSAPDSLWTDLQALLKAQSNRRQAELNGLGSYWFHLTRPRWIAAAAMILFAIGVAALWIYLREARPSWGVARIDGTPRIGSNSINEKGRLAVGQWLETDGVSRAKIEVGNIGQVEIDPNTRVRLVATKPTEHRLELARGRMSALIWAPPKLFFVDTPSAVAADLGCAYTLEVDDHGGSLLRVTLGWVALQLKDRESMVPAGAACATRAGIGPGTPYFEDASEEFRAALSHLDFEGNGTQWSRVPPFELVLQDARPRDTLTLWHLLPRLEGEDRARVYERMAELVPPPDGVTRAGVLALDQQMLDSWKDKLEASWSNYSSPSIKALKKVWTGGLGKIHGLEGKK
jgi:Putative zinc-finger/FecR protein